MIAGHFGLAAAVKGREPTAPLWALMLATAWLDVVFVPLFLTHVETLEPAPGAPPGYGAAIIHADYTHSLVGALLLSALLGGLCAWAFGRRVGVVVGAVAFSHWLLDLIVHRPDLPILPGNYGGAPKLGFGLWRMPAISATVELALVAAGAWIYWRAARRAAGAAGSGQRLADACGAMALGFGLLVLALDVTGALG